MANRITVVLDVISDRASRSLTQFKQNIAEAEGGFNKMKAAGAGAFELLKQNAATIAPVVAAFALKIGRDAVNAASNLGESMNAVAKVFGTASEEIYELGESADESMGLSQRAFNEAAVAFSSFAKQVAGPGGDVAGVVEDLTQRAADFASVMNIDVSEAVRIFQSGLAGETEALRRYGVDVSAATVNTYAYENGIADVGEKLTEQEKILARYGVIMAGTSQTAGDFADTSDSLANSQRRLNAQLENLLATVGEELVPKMERGTGALNDFLDAADTEVAGLSIFDGLGKLADQMIRSLTIGKEVPRVLKSIGSEIADGFDPIIVGSIETMEDYGRAQRMVADEIDDARTFVDSLTESYANQWEVIQQANEERQREIDLLAEARDEHREYTDAVYAAEEANEDLAGAVQRAYETLFDANATAEDQREALRSVARAADDAATAQLELDGVTRDSERGQQLWTRSMLATAATLKGPVRAELLAYIARMNGIPDEKITQIMAKGDRLALIRLENELAYLTRQRTVTIVPRRAGGTGSNSFFAKGTQGAPPGAAVVGEQGPELVELPAGAKVHTAERTREMVGSSGPRQSVTNIYLPQGVDPLNYARSRRRWDRIQGPI